LKKAEESASLRFFYRHLKLVGNVHFALHCGRNCIRRRVNRHQNISVFLTVKSRVLDRRIMDTDIPSQEGRENLPSELSLVSAPRETDPMPVVTRPSEVG